MNIIRDHSKYVIGKNITVNRGLSAK
jgi:hypothetical protein